MKKIHKYLVDEFLMEKFINQWIWEKMYWVYMWVFKLIIENSKNIDLEDTNTYTTNNFKKFLWENFIEKKWSSATYNKYRKCLKAYCRYLVDEWYLEFNPIDKITKRKEEKLIPRTLDYKQIKELKETIEKMFSDEIFTEKRNKTMVYTYLYTGMRLSELTNLKTEDLKIEEWYLKVLKGKWNKQRIIPLSKEIVKILYNYKKDRETILRKSEYFFPTIKGNILQQRDMRAIIEKIRKWITFYFTWHQLRHTFATELVRNNFDVYNISQILWHSKIDTTKIYLSTDVTRFKKQIDKLWLFNN